MRERAGPSRTMKEIRAAIPSELQDLPHTIERGNVVWRPDPDVRAAFRRVLGLPEQPEPARPFMYTPLHFRTAYDAQRAAPGELPLVQTPLEAQPLPYLDVPAGEFVSWERANDYGWRPIAVTDWLGETVVVYPKHAERHQSWHSLQHTPEYHVGVAAALKCPETVRFDTSNNPKAVGHRQGGNHVVVTELYNFTEKIDSPMKDTAPPPDALSVTTKYMRHPRAARVLTSFLEEAAQRRIHLR